MIESRQSPDKGVMEAISNNKGIKALLGGAIAASAVICLVNCKGESESTEMAGGNDERVESAVVSPSAETTAHKAVEPIKIIPYTGQPKEKFVLKDFAIPESGREITRSTHEEGGKNVIYIVDYHENGKTVSEYQQSIQKEIFEIVQDILNKYGTVALTLEAWKAGESANADMASTYAGTPLYELFNEPSLRARMKMVPTLMQSAKIAGPVILGVFQSNVLPVGTETDEDRKAANELVHMERRLRDAVYGSASFCTNNNGRSISYFEYSEAFRAGGSAATDHCYCAVHSYEEKFLDKLKERLTNVPVKEVDYALAVDHDFVVMIAGSKHWSTAQKSLEERGVNYVAIAPRKLTDSFDDQAEETSLKPLYPDSANGRCDSLMREQRALVEAALGRI